MSALYLTADSPAVLAPAIISITLPALLPCIRVPESYCKLKSGTSMATPNQLTIYAPDYVGEQQTGSQDSQLHATAQHSHSNIAGLSGYAFSDSPQPYPSNPFGASYKSSQQFALMDLHPPVPYYRPTYEFPYDPSQGVGSVPKYVSSQSPLMLQSQPQLHQQQLQPPQLQQQQYQQSQQLYGHLLQSRYLLSSQRAFGD